jgi:hypothetical protein
MDDGEWGEPNSMPAFSFTHGKATSFWIVLLKAMLGSPSTTRELPTTWHTTLRSP